MSIGEQLKRSREARGLTQPELARVTGVSIHTIRGYEQGARRSQWGPFILLCRASRSGPPHSRCARKNRINPRLTLDRHIIRA